MGIFDRSKHPRGRGGRFTDKPRTEPTGSELAPESSPTRMHDGTVEWRTPDGKLHRTDGPALCRFNGVDSWWKHDTLHRTDGPAITDQHGGEIWYQDGKLHRTDGPAIIRPDGGLEWWENGERKSTEVEAMLTMVWLARTPKRHEAF